MVWALTRSGCVGVVASVVNGELLERVVGERDRSGPVSEPLDRVLKFGQVVEQTAVLEAAPNHAGGFALDRFTTSTGRQVADQHG